MTEGKPRKTWVWVVVGLLIVAVVGFAAFIGLSVMVVARNMQVTQVGEADAERQFEQERERFGNQKPLVEMRDEAVVSRDELDRRIAAYEGPAPQTMRVLAWSPAENKLVRLALPFWFLRMGSRGSFTLDLPGGPKRELKVTTDEIERAGPGLFMDATVEGARVLIWTE